MMGGFGRVLSLIGAGLLATVLFVTHPGFAFAQDVNDSDADVVEQPDTMVVNLSGCWQGTAFNDSQGNTSILLFFKQKQNKILKNGSTFDLESAAHVNGAISGKVKGTQFKFRGKVTGTGFPCSIRGTGSLQTDNTLTGGYRYSGQCFENQFTSGEFSKVTFLGATCP
jgi:hypothetical protein